MSVLCDFGVGTGVGVVGAGMVLWRALELGAWWIEAYHMSCAWWYEQYVCVCE